MIKKFYIIILSLITSSHVAVAQNQNAMPKTLENLYSHAGTWTSQQNFNTGFTINSILFNKLSNSNSPILSPETGNSPSSFGLYINAPISNGWNDTWSATSGNGTYSQMITDYLTLTPVILWELLLAVLILRVVQ